MYRLVFADGTLQLVDGTVFVPISKTHGEFNKYKPDDWVVRLSRLVL